MLPEDGGAARPPGPADTQPSLHRSSSVSREHDRMMQATCPSCSVTTSETLWKERQVAEVIMPFWARYDIARALCPGCTTQLRMAVASFAPAEPIVWTRDNEIL